jgi:glycosyltransferase involved in cell wall biosynthesis
MSAARIPILIAAADIESGVTSWALRLRAVLVAHPRYDVRVINCWRTGKGVGSFDAEITTEAAMRAYLRAHPSAVVMPNFVWELFLLCAELVKQGLPLRTLAYAHSDSDAEYYAPLAWLDSTVGRYLAASQTCADNLGVRLPHRRGEIVSLPYGVEVPDPLNRNWQAKPLRLIYGGRIVQKQKRVMDFVPLVSALQKNQSDFTLTIIGSGAQRDELQCALDALPHGGRVVFQPPVPAASMAQIWRAHDVFLQVSEFEGTSCSMLEAMAEGCVPFVTDASSGVRGVITPGTNGGIVPIGAMEELAAQLHQLTVEPSQVQAMGQAAHATAGDYAMPAYAACFIEQIDLLTASPPRPIGTLTAKRKGTPLESQHRFLKPGLAQRILERLVS